MNKTIKYPQINLEKKSGVEQFLNAGINLKLQDFWSWAYSDINGNTERGKLAEYIVAFVLLSRVY